MALPAALGERHRDAVAERYDRPIEEDLEPTRRFVELTERPPR